MHRYSSHKTELSILSHLRGTASKKTATQCWDVQKKSTATHAHKTGFFRTFSLVFFSCSKPLHYFEHHKFTSPPPPSAQYPRSKSVWTVQNNNTEIAGNRLEKKQKNAPEFSGLQAQKQTRLPKIETNTPTLRWNTKKNWHIWKKNAQNVSHLSQSLTLPFAFIFYSFQLPW